MDMANNIWSWEGDPLKYNPNPNPFFSLKEPTFLIGLRLASRCIDAEVLHRVKQWLIVGLQSGIGSQVNTGYGELIRAGAKKLSSEFFRIEFSLEGQLIHGRQKFSQWSWNDRRNEWQMRGMPDAEVRPVAFKSMLRYWFRALALGVLERTTDTREWEAKLFGAINPQELGWVRFEIRDGIMFRLGGIGQGARRPCYSRKNSDRGAPWYRGSTLSPDSKDSFWRLPETLEEFQKLFRQHLQQFYQALSQLIGSSINPHSLKTIGQVERDRWIEAIDANCRIVVCAGDEDFGKPYALAVLHSKDLKTKDRNGREDYDGNLCGQVTGGAKASPVWIADLDDYQVVTVFGATQNPRLQYLQALRKDADGYAQIWPLS